MEREGSRRTWHSSGARDSGLDTAEIERKSVSNVTFQSLNSCRSLVNARCSLSRRSLFMLSFISPSIHPFGSRFSVADPLFFKPLSGSLSYCSVATAIRNKKVQAYNFQRKIEGERTRTKFLSRGNINVALLVARPPLCERRQPIMPSRF